MCSVFPRENLVFVFPLKCVKSSLILLFFTLRNPLVTLFLRLRVLSEAVAEENNSGDIRSRCVAEFCLRSRRASSRAESFVQLGIWHHASIRSQARSARTRENAIFRYVFIFLTIIFYIFVILFIYLQPYFNILIICLMKFKKLSFKQFSILSHKYEHFRSIIGNQLDLPEYNRFIKYRFIVFEKFVVVRLTVFTSLLRFKVFFIRYDMDDCFSSKVVLDHIIKFASKVSI